MAADAPLAADISSELMDTGTDAFDFGLDHNEPAPAVKRKDAYENIMGFSMGENQEGGGNKALSQRLVAFREWLKNEGKVTSHPHLCVVNGEATDGTKNAPVLTYGPPPGVNPDVNPADGRIGMIDGEADRALYDRKMGCEVRAAKEIKKDDVLITVPRATMVTPDLVAASDAGRAVLACCEPEESNGAHFWGSFENTAICERNCAAKLQSNNGTQLLVKVLQERKKAETAATKSLRSIEESLLQSGGLTGVGKSKAYLAHKLAAKGKISTRAPFLAFLIHQRFSDSISPEVCDGAPQIAEEMEDSRNGLSTAERINRPPGSPVTFGPYVRTMPSAVPLPLCWKRNELALLTCSVPGIQTLREVAGMTVHLVAEFISLVEAGILHRFPSVFPRGLVTWERWVWAASVFASRNLPSSCYLDSGDVDAHAHMPDDPQLFQSTPDVWDELGVLIPFVDMLNHEPEAAHVTWQPPPKQEDGNGENKEEESHPPRAISHRRVKKGSQVYTDYGPHSNHAMILQYGFGLINNSSDELQLGWALADGIGNVDAPEGYSPPVLDPEVENGSAQAMVSNGDAEPSIPKKPKSSDKEIGLVFESTEPTHVNTWWTEERLSLLERDALLSDQFIGLLRAGKKMVATSYNDGSFHPGLLSAALVATMESARVRAQAALRKSGEEARETFLSITKSHQEVLRQYLIFFFSRKIEKLLHGLNNGLKGHFEDVNLWTKASEGGLSYSSGDGSVEGWNKFFEGKVYFTSAEVEKRYYALSPESCVLALYDGHLRALQTSIDELSNEERFKNGVLRQLEELSFKVLPNDELPQEEVDAMEAMGAVDSNPVAKEEETDASKKAGDGTNGKAREKNKSKSRRRNRKRSNGGSAGSTQSGDRPAAIKIHIGNLAYCTLASDLFEYFAATYGRENVLECHIPTERESGRSRGFGFVTMPEAISTQALQPGKKHEVHGRLLKVAESNSAGSANRNRGPSVNAIMANDRCARCGYRPRYCVCAVPDIPAFNGVAGRAYHDDIRGPGPEHGGDPYVRGDPDYDHYGGSYRRERARDYSMSPSPGRHRSGSGARRDRDYGRYDREYDRHRRSRSPSYNQRDRDRDRDRSRRRSGDRGRDRERDRRSRDRRRSFDDRGRQTRYSRSRSRGGASSDRSASPPSPRRDRDRDRDHERRSGAAKPDEPPPRARDFSESGSASPPAVATSSDRKRDRDSRRRSRSRSRSRSRGKSGKRKRSSKKEGKKHGRARSPH